MRGITASLRSITRRLGRRPRLGRGLLGVGILAAVLVLAAMSAWTLPAPADDAPARRNLVATSSPAHPAAVRPAHPVRPAARRPAPSPVIAAAGDIACDPASRNFRRGHSTATACHMGATARLLRRLDPQVVLTLGDNQYGNGPWPSCTPPMTAAGDGSGAGLDRPPATTTTGPPVPPATSTTSAPPPAAVPGATTASTWAAGT